jgi:hypothetical protein
MRTLLLGLATFLSIATTAMADSVRSPLVSAAPNVTIISPTPEEMAAVFPDAARGRNIEGRVVLLCNIRTNDTLDCRAVSWSPSRLGFETAALALAGKLRVKSNDQNSYAGRAFDFPIRFPADSGDGSSPPPAPVPGALTAALPPPPHVVTQAPGAEPTLPYLMPVNGKVFEIDKSREPWVVTFHLIGVARLRACSDKDAAPAQQAVGPGTTMPVADGQKVELYMDVIKSWSEVNGAARCPSTPG